MTCMSAALGVLLARPDECQGRLKPRSHSATRSRPETQVGSLPLLEADRLRALPEGLAPELSEFRGPFEHRGEMVPASWPALLANAVGPYGTRISVSLTPLG